MGMKGTLEYFAGLFGGGHKHKKKKKKKKPAALLRLFFDSVLLMIADPYEIIIFPSCQCPLQESNQKVTVVGYVEANKVLKKAKSTGKKAEIWPYVPYSLVSQPYTAGTYDKKAPPGYVRNVEAVAGSSQSSRQEDQIANMFNDDNPNSCSVM